MCIIFLLDSLTLSFASIFNIFRLILLYLSSFFPYHTFHSSPQNASLMPFFHLDFFPEPPY